MSSNEIEYGVLSDVHFGAFDHNRLSSELEIFLDSLENSRWKVLYISGDLFHMKMSANSPHMKAALKFMAEVFNICREKNIKLRIIKGTASHDNEQLDLLSALEIALNVDFRVINVVDREELFPNFKVLYIPEEYVENMDTYYEEYFNDTYDMIIGHGLVDKAVFVAHLQESEETRKSAPIFPLKKLHEICVGPIYFGHIHKHMSIDRFRYVSSYSRWSFGESEPKGFILGKYNTETKDFSDLFITNIKAQNFDTVKISESSELFKLSPQDIVLSVVETTSDVIKDHIRVEINIPTNYTRSALLINLLNETIKNRNIKLKVISTQKEKMVEEIREKVDQMLDKYRIIFDKGVPVEVKLSEYIKIKYDVNIPIDEMKVLLTEKLQ